MPSGTIKVKLQEEDFRVRSSSDPPNPVSKVYGVFSNRILLPCSGRQPRATDIAHVYDMKYFKEVVGQPGQGRETLSHNKQKLQLYTGAYRQASIKSRVSSQLR